MLFNTAAFIIALKNDLRLVILIANHNAIVILVLIKEICLRANGFFRALNIVITKSAFQARAIRKRAILPFALVIGFVRHRSNFVFQPIVLRNSYFIRNIRIAFEHKQQCIAIKAGIHAQFYLYIGFGQTF